MHYSSRLLRQSQGYVGMCNGCNNKEMNKWKRLLVCAKKVFIRWDVLSQAWWSAEMSWRNDLQLLNDCNSLMMAREMLGEHHRSSTSRHLQLESLLSSCVSRFVEGTAWFVEDEVDDNHAKRTNVDTLASDSLELDEQSNVELLFTTKRGVLYLQVTPRCQGRHLLYL